MTSLLESLTRYEVIIAMMWVGMIMYVSNLFSRYLLRDRIPGVALAIGLGLVFAYFGGAKGVADYPILAGMAVIGGSMMRDYSIVATAMGASISEIRKAGGRAILSLFVGILAAFGFGAVVALAMGYHDSVSVATIGAGACTFIVGPVTGTALGASSEVIAMSIATGVIKTIFVTIVTPLAAKRIGLDNPQTAMAYGGIIGTTSGVAAGLAATDPKLVPYGALTATFYTGMGCLLCPSVLFFILRLILG
jgi:malonate transporter MadM subunit